MKIALIGATGNIGTEIAKEALARGHEVTAIVRNPDRVPAQSNLKALKGDLNGDVAPLLESHDVVATSVHFVDFDPQALIGAVKRAGVPRLMVVGGAGSLRSPDGTRVVDSPDFPEAWKAEALGGAAMLDILKSESDLDWTYLSPSAIIAPGERTGRFRLGEDDLLIGEDGQSRISQADYAIAFVDELENAAHPRRRFTVGY